MVCLIGTVLIPGLAVGLTLFNKYYSKYKSLDSEYYLNNEKKNKILRFNKLIEHIESEIDWWFFFDKCACYILRREIANDIMLNSHDLSIKESDLELFDNGEQVRIGKYVVRYINKNNRGWLKIYKLF